MLSMLFYIALYSDCMTLSHLLHFLEKADTMAVKVRREGECFHKHTYLASCHHIGELWVLINS